MFSFTTCAPATSFFTRPVAKLRYEMIEEQLITVGNVKSKPELILLSPATSHSESSTSLNERGLKDGKDKQKQTGKIRHKEQIIF